MLWFKAGLYSIGSRMRTSAFWKYSLQLIAVPFIVAGGATVALVLIAHVSLGSRSPGVVALWSRGLEEGHLQALFLVAFAIPTAFNLWVIFRLARRGRQHGLTWYDYLDKVVRERRGQK